MLFVDLWSAFNTVVPQKLVNKLSNLGLTITPCSWILDFLTNRLQTGVGNRISSSLTLNTGALQACVLSLALFTLFTHECTPIHSSNSIVKFAEDSIVWLISGNDETHDKEEEEWCSDNDLVLNTTKTKEIVVDYSETRKTIHHLHKWRGR